MTTWTNPENGKTLTITIHDVWNEFGEWVARVNKGDAKSHATFTVRVADTNLVLA